MKILEYIGRIAIDSRDVQPGGLFIALPGAKTDGHHHLEEVAKRGAKAAVVRNDSTGPDFGLEFIRVDKPAADLTG